MVQVGTNGDDPASYFNSTDPVIYGLDGNDVITFLSGVEEAYIEGGRGNDIITTGDRRAIVYGGDGDDIISGGYNPSYRDSFPGDRFYGGAGNDTIRSGGGNDSIYGEDGDDTLYGARTDGWVGIGNHTVLDGGAGNDVIYGGTGFGGTIYGGEGDDIIHVEAARVAYGGPGNDVYELTVAPRSDPAVIFETREGTFQPPNIDVVYAYIDFTLPDEVEHLVMLYGTQAYGYGNGGNNIIVGNASANVIEGKAGYDTLTGGDGSDLFVVNPAWGVDVITDFAAGTGSPDAVMFAKSIFSSFDQVMARSRQVGADVWIEDGAGNTVVLANTLIGSLAHDDFGFF